MLIKFGGGVLDARGSIGGNTFSRNRYGAYVRSRVVPVNPQTGRQSAARAIMSTVSKNWFDALSDAQRTAWNDYAAAMPETNKLGETIHFSGFNQYCKSNAAAINAGLAAIAAGPTTYVKPGEDPVFAVAVSEATQLATITFDDTADWCDENGAAMIIQVGKPVGDSITYFNGPWRATAAIEGDSVTPPSTGATVACSFYCAADQQIFIRARILRADGRLGDWFRGSCICGA